MERPWCVMGIPQHSKSVLHHHSLLKLFTAFNFWILAGHPKIINTEIFRFTVYGYRNVLNVANFDVD